MPMLARRKRNRLSKRLALIICSIYDNQLGWLTAYRGWYIHRGCLHSFRDLVHQPGKMLRMRKKRRVRAVYRKVHIRVRATRHLGLIFGRNDSVIGSSDVPFWNAREVIADV